MKVITERPFQLIYSLYPHQYLGYIFAAYVVQLNDKGGLMLSNQNISRKNAEEFAKELDEKDFRLVEIMDELNPDSLVGRFYKKKIKANDFFFKTFNSKYPDDLLKKEIESYLERRRTQIMKLITGKNIYEMGCSGEPAWRKINMLMERASVLFHFRRNPDNTHYFPTIKLRNKKINFINNGSFLVCKEPAWMVVKNELFTFDKPISGGKLLPFFKKNYIKIPKTIEEEYFKKFVAPLVESSSVYAKGFDIQTKTHDLRPKLVLSELQEASSQPTLFNETTKPDQNTRILVQLFMTYGGRQFKMDQLRQVSVYIEKQEGNYIFHRVRRNLDKEAFLLKELTSKGLNLRNSLVTIDKGKIFSWLDDNRSFLKENDFEISQQNNKGKSYFLGECSIDVKIEEKIDWFDVQAVVHFGTYQIPFKVIRKHILNKKHEIKLPNGEIGVIPDSWVNKYSDLLAFTVEQNDALKLKKHNLALVYELSTNQSANVSITEKLKRLLDFDQIENVGAPSNFKGKLRAYQQSGVNWLCFLDHYGFGGCLADDMGLGKTIQTLVLLGFNIEKGRGCNLLVMPTSLIYNWRMEASRFIPDAKILVYTGSIRAKNIAVFSNYDIIITSYGIARIDADLLSQHYFNYVVLDESQAIKNPESITAKKIRQLNSRRRLILSGTPIENSAMDLWSQLSFANPGFLGSKQFFNKKYLIPIEKRKNPDASNKLNTMIKPFVLRREKSQVATDLPEKIIALKYCEMSTAQKEIYERHKNHYRDKILGLIESNRLKESGFLVLQGLSKLRQIANHPALIDSDYSGDSTKYEDITHSIENALVGSHNILIFSQFVKHLKLISRFLDKKKIRYSYLDGSVRDRKEQVKNFQEEDSIPVFLISLKAGGLGLNLTKADYVFILDPWWNPAIEAQAVDRAHRIGQKNKVFTYKFISKDTVEEKILKLQDGKLKLAQDLITVEESFVKNLNKEDIANLFN